MAAFRRENSHSRSESSASSFLPQGWRKQPSRQHQKSDHPHNAQVSHGVLIEQTSFLVEQGAAIRADLGRDGFHSVPVGREQQRADSEAVNIRAHSAAHRPGGGRTFHTGEHAEYHGQKSHRQPACDLGNGDQRRRQSRRFFLPPQQAEPHHAEQEAGEIRIIDHPVIGNGPGEHQRKPIAAIPQKSLSRPVEIRVLGAPETEQQGQGNALAGGQAHVPGKPLLDIGAQPEGQRAGKRQPAPNPEGPQHEIAHNRIEHRDQNHIQVKDQREIVGKQPGHCQVNGVQHTVIGVCGGGFFIKGPAQQSAAPQGFLHVLHPGHPVATVQQRHRPVHLPQPKGEIFHRQAGHHRGRRPEQCRCPPLLLQHCFSFPLRLTERPFRTFCAMISETSFPKPFSLICRAKYVDLEGISAQWDGICTFLALWTGIGKPFSPVRPFPCSRHRARGTGNPAGRGGLPATFFSFLLRQNMI